MEDINLHAFEEIKHTNSNNGTEYWFARELRVALEYTDWRNFVATIEKAMESCTNAGIDHGLHFARVEKTYNLPTGGIREIGDIALTRYACYLIAQNGDPSKETIAKAQAYFAIQTRRQELADQFPELPEDERRLAVRAELVRHNIQLAEAARNAGVIDPLDYAIFQNEGYKGLYGGLTAKDIHARKGLKKSHQILDYMGSMELAANLFRATQTEEILRRENVKGKQKANTTHYDVGCRVRQTIKDLGNPMPEDLPTPEKSIKQIEHATKQLPKGKGKRPPSSRKS